MNTLPLTKEQCDEFRKAFPSELAHMTNFEINLIRDDLHELLTSTQPIESSGATKSLATLGDFFPA